MSFNALSIMIVHFGKIYDIKVNLSKSFLRLDTISFVLTCKMALLVLSSLIKELFVELNYENRLTENKKEGQIHFILPMQGLSFL